MKIDNNINKVIAENLDIKRIVSGGGILWERNSLWKPLKLHRYDEFGTCFWFDHDYNKYLPCKEIRFRLKRDFQEKYKAEPAIRYLQNKDGSILGNYTTKKYTSEYCVFFYKSNDVFVRHNMLDETELWSPDKSIFNLSVERLEALAGLELMIVTSYDSLEAKNRLQIQFGNGTWFNGDGVAPNIGRDIRTMPTTVDGYKVTITWKSSNLNIMTDDGKRFGKGDVSLIATIRDNNGDTETKEFKLIII
ncbi:hypothetical protein QP531_06350 [Peptoniphilus harei]|uniref:immunoglobulin-like domain-containing protein n=1 Tax=Peptoniphilus harei TaxID=54005 RepID=UPI00254B216C|nr:immunoglobulin-like domain-containing protein [Peptoniphilus harei]MDK7377436.1 hypothetical protein [Peptoniphilus harei]MDK7679749.1 hypothetical protein [Peptoniphilus harei]